MNANIEANRQAWGNEASWFDDGERWSQDWGGSQNLWDQFIYPRISEQLVGANFILEIATGYGRISKFLIPLCNKFIGVDLNENCIAYCKSKYDGIFLVNDGLSLPVAYDSIDFVFSWDSLVHCSSEVVESYLIDIYDVLVSGGSAFLHHSNWRGSGAKNNPHWRDETCSADEIADFAQEVGFEVSQELYAWGNAYKTDCFTTLRKSKS